MAARDQLVLSLRALTLRSPASSNQVSRCFSTTTVDRASTVQQRRRHRDPYALAQARARKAANLSRQEVLKKERAAALGDPVRGQATPFVQSFDTAFSTSPHADISSTIERKQGSNPQQPIPGPDATNEELLNYFVKKSELEAAIARSEDLNSTSARYQSTDGSDRTAGIPEQHATATEALKRITSLANGSSKDRLRVNIQRCISTFGRHYTDAHLTPKASVADEISEAAEHSGQLKKTPRAGVDTGSSEVQIAILTAKIRTLADFLETRGRGDKVNKRNLRLLVHRRQKLLTYLKRKERGGPRWQNIIETLGLTPGTYEGEISL